MKTRVKICLLLLMWVACCPAFGQEKPIVLGGLDPVQLVSGKEVAGNPGIHVERGRFRYLFADEAAKTTFLGRPDEFSVQNEDRCAVSPNMTADPDLFAVYKGRIYLFGSRAILRQVKQNPERTFAIAKALAAARLAAPKVGILVYPGCQSIDVNGPFDMLVAAHINVFLVAEKPGPVSCNTGMAYTPEFSFKDCPKLDAIVVPGGFVLSKGDERDPLILWIKARSAETQYTLSVCNGALMCALAGIMDGKEATTTHLICPMFAKAFPSVKVVTDRRIVEDGNVISTGQGTAGIDGALRLVELLKGHAEAEQVALDEEYRWEPGGRYIRGNLAEPLLRAAIGPGFKLPDGWKAEVTELGGDPAQWVKEWSISGPEVTSAALLKAVNDQLSTTWKKTRQSAGAIDYSFADPKGNSWTGRAEVAVAGDSKVMTLKITIHLGAK